MKSTLLVSSIIVIITLGIALTEKKRSVDNTCYLTGETKEVCGNNKGVKQCVIKLVCKDGRLI